MFKKIVKIAALSVFLIVPVVAGNFSKYRMSDQERMILQLDCALENEQFSEAARLIYLFKIRTALDVVCCTDPSAAAAMDMLTIRQWTKPEQFQKINDNLSQEQLRAIAIQVANEVEQQLNAHALPSPEWVARYSMGAFTGTPSEFVPMSECHKKRMETLTQMKKSFVS